MPGGGGLEHVRHVELPLGLLGHEHHLPVADDQQVAVPCDGMQRRTAGGRRRVMRADHGGGGGVSSLLYATPPTPRGGRHGQELHSGFPPPRQGDARGSADACLS